YPNLTWLSLAALAGTAPWHTERSVEELKLMTTPELAGEARLACQLALVSLTSAQEFSKLRAHDKAIAEYNQAADKRQSLQRIGLVLRDRQQGQMPAWFEQFGQAIDSKNEPECDTAATAGGWRPKQ